MRFVSHRGNVTEHIIWEFTVVCLTSLVFGHINCVYAVQAVCSKPPGAFRAVEFWGHPPLNEPRRGICRNPRSGSESDGGRARICAHMNESCRVYEGIGFVSMTVCIYDETHSYVQHDPFIGNESDGG